MDYRDFVAGKGARAASSGWDPGPEVGAWLFPWQAQIVRWACRRGRSAIFADTGLGKTAMQIAWAAKVADYTKGRVLILAPLAVGAQTEAEADRFGARVSHVREDNGAPIVVTNYERLHRYDPRAFAGIVLDESSILKAYDGKTRTEIIQAFAATPYRLACTATPAPNDHTELGNHAEFLGVMTRLEMLAMFFCHDGGETQKWQIKGHAKGDFWRWVATWAAVVRHPRDLGFEDARYDLPPVKYHEHVIRASADHAKAAGRLFVEPATTLGEQRKARQATVSDRVGMAAQIANETEDAVVVWCDLNTESTALAKAIRGAVEVTGSMSTEDKEEAVRGFAAGAHRVIVSKPSICGFGLNWQHCRTMIFVGVSHSFEQFYQAVRRCWRFGQTQRVRVHVVTGELEGAVVENVKRKQAEADTMAKEMAELTRDAVRAELGEASTPAPRMHVESVASGKTWTLHLGDCVDVVRSLAPDSVDYTVFSPPFASLYTYSDSPRDMGNVKDHAEFARHFGYLVPDLLRVTRPGRLLSFHCMNLPTSKSRDGYIGITDFRGTLIRAFVDAGWIFHSEVVIWKDPVTAMQRTKALGLLHKQLKKDSCMSRQGIPDYLVTMRKPGDNPKRVTHTNDSFPVDRWQRYASPVWMDIRPSDTLQKESAREDEDERHICPLQLEVIRRAIELWTAPGDLVLSPFAGIGSEGYVALQEGRRFVGAELKRSYWEQARKNLASVEVGTKAQVGMFDAAP